MFLVTAARKPSVTKVAWKASFSLYRGTQPSRAVAPKT
jgi:hypothetical protein